jgi:transcriptional regulator with XRE-family HTH domain
MKIIDDVSDEAILRELGQRLARIRLDRNLTQAQLAELAGLSKRTVERLESGEVATQLSGFVRVCRALDLLERLETMVPELAPSPIVQLKQRGHARQRASRATATAPASRAWTWGAER